MSFVPTNLIQKMSRDPLFRDIPVSTLQTNLDIRLGQLLSRLHERLGAVHTMNQ